MSYCRFSSDGYQCDVYAYESAIGYEVHVAFRRYVFKTQVPPCEDVTNVEELVKWHAAISAAVEEATQVPLSHPDAGESKCFQSATDAAEYLTHLRDTGLRVPQYAIDSLLAGE